jgi:hypothetical protein
MHNDYITELPEEEKPKEDFNNLTPEECLQEIRNILNRCEEPKQKETEDVI